MRGLPGYGSGAYQSHIHWGVQPMICKHEEQTMMCINPVSLRELRIQRGLTQCDLAKMLGISQQTLSQTEKAGGGSVKKLERTFKLLGAELLMGVDPEWERPASCKPVTSYVYILEHSTFPIFKVGKADDVELRALTFADVADIQAKFRADNFNEAFAAELILHRAFRQWRLTPKEALTIGVPEDGSTEWFESACLDRMHGFIAANQDLLRLALNL